MKREPVTVELDVDALGRGELLIDGRKIRRVRAVSIDAEAGDLTRVVVTIIPDKLVVTLKADAGSVEVIDADGEPAEADPVR